MGGGNWRFGFCFYICKVKTALGTYPIWQRCIYMHAEQRKLEKLTSRMFLGWVCREARPLFLYPLSSPKFLRLILTLQS